MAMGVRGADVVDGTTGVVESEFFPFEVGEVMVDICSESIRG